MDTLYIESPSLRLGFSPQNGALVSAVSNLTGWQIMGLESLGESFRLLVPLSADRRNHSVYGKEQTNCRAAKTENGLAFSWRGVTGETGLSLDIDVDIRVEAEGDGIVFTATVNNKSPYMIEAVQAPYLAQVSCPKKARKMHQFSYWYNSAMEHELYPSFTNHIGYYGTLQPTQLSPWSGNIINPSAPFRAIKTEDEGLYIGVHSQNAEPVAFGFELHPGYESWYGSAVPRQDEIGGLPVHISCAAMHYPYVKPGEACTLAPICMQAYTGDWSAAALIYRTWREGWMECARIPDWARQPHAWLQIQVNSAEGELRVPYKELPGLARECRENGITVIQVTGWNNGGQDKNNPSHSTDPGLGTFEELRDAIAECQKMGVRIVLFTKFIWADRATEWYRDELKALAAKDPYGDIYAHPGFRYLTPTQLVDINTRRFAAMCFLSDDYRRICADEFGKCVALRADGILFDECLSHGPALLCFDEGHGHRYGQSLYQQDNTLIREFAQRLGEGREDFLFAGEACYDQQMQTYNFSYIRSQLENHIPLERFLMPGLPIATAVIGFNDRHIVNQCLLYRYILSHEPRNFKGRPTDYPLTLAYARQMEALRLELRKWLWDGEFCHHAGFELTPKNSLEAELAWAVYRADDGTAAMVVVNFSESCGVFFSVAGSQAFAHCRTVEAPQAAAPDGVLALPPKQAMVLW